MCLLQMVLHGTPPGTWYVGVYCEHLAGINYTLAVARFACPMECSGHGQCSQHECTCDEVRRHVIMQQYLQACTHAGLCRRGLQHAAYSVGL